ncbi:MAG TPA: DUF308 domain-containing protein [Gaiellaceae bacterium]|nr:DUF308 domain-containing protein [Gaiellaceae bacterium]
MDSLYDRSSKLAKTQVKKMRWALGLNGLVSVAVGVMILVWPGISVYALTIVFGIWALATGLVNFGTAFTSEAKEQRWWFVLSGLIGIATGVVVLAWPSISAVALLYVIGVYAMLLGIAAIVGSLQLPLDGRDTALMILSGLVSIVFSVVIFAKPGAGALAVLALIAAFALVTGVCQLVIAIGGEELLERKAKAKLTPKARPQPSH